MWSSDYSGLTGLRRVGPEDREGRGADMSEREGGTSGFRREIRTALRYERGLVIKALAALALMAVIVVLRTLYFS